MNGVRHPDPPATAIAPRPSTELLRQEIESIGSNLGGLIGELDRRRHEAFNVRLQLRRHPVAMALGAVALMGLVAGALAAGVAGRRRRRALLGGRVRRFRRGLARMMEAPPREIAERRGPRPAGRLLITLLTVGGKAAAAILSRRRPSPRLRSRR